MERKTLFAQVILPLPVPGSFTYRIPFEMNDWIMKGQRVLVQFGSRKVYAGLVLEVHERIPKNYQPKYVLGILDEKPIVNELQLKFWEWMAHYYISQLGEVMNAALPAAFKLSSESRLILNPDFKVGSIVLNEKEAAILTALQSQAAISISQAAEISDLRKVFPLINNLKEKGVILLEEELEDRYKVKSETYLRLNEVYLSEEGQKELFEQLEKRAYKQLEVVMAFLHLAMKEGGAERSVRKKAVLAQMENGDSPLRSLIKKEILTSFEQKASRLKDYESEQDVSQIELSQAQDQGIFNLLRIFWLKKTLVSCMASQGVARPRFISS